MWALFEQGKLRPDSELSGHFVFDEGEVDVDSVMQSIDDARREAIIRQRGRELAEAEG
jgi:RIO kinase 1